MNLSIKKSVYYSVIVIKNLRMIKLIEFKKALCF